MSETARRGDEANQSDENQHEKRKVRIVRLPLPSIQRCGMSTVDMSKKKKKDGLQQHPSPAPTPLLSRAERLVGDETASLHTAVEPTTLTMVPHPPYTPLDDLPLSRPSTPSPTVFRQRSPPETDNSSLIIANTSRTVEPPFVDTELVPERSIFQRTREHLEYAEQMYLKMGQRLQNTRLDSAKVKEEQEEKIKTLTSAINIKVSAARSLRKTNNRLVGEIGALKQETIDLKQVSETVRTQNATQESQIRDHKTNSERLNEDIILLKGVRDTQDKTIKELEATKHSLTTDKTDATKKMAALQETLDGVNKQMKAQDRQITSSKNSETGLQSEIKKLTASEQLLRADKSALIKDNDKLQFDVTSWRNVFNLCKTEKVRLESTLATKSTVLEEVNIKITNLERRTAELESIDQVNVKRILDLESKIVESGCIIEKQTAELSALTALCNERKTDIEEKNARLVNMQRNSEKFHGELDTELKAAESKERQLHSENKAYSAKLTASENLCGRLRREIEDATGSANEGTTKITSLRRKMGELASERDAATLQAQYHQARVADLENKTGQGVDAATGMGPALSPVEDTLNFQDRCVLYKAYDDFPDLRYQLRFDGWVIPRRTVRKEWIGRLKAEAILGAEGDEERADALIAPYGKITDSRLEIFIDNRLVRRGFQTLPASKKEPEWKTLEAAGISISEGDMECNTPREAYKALTMHRVPSWRDLALANKAELVREAEVKRARELPIVAATPPDPRLQIHPMVNRTVPIAVMVAPEQQPKAATEDVARCIATNLSSEAGLAQMAPLINDECTQPYPERPMNEGLCRTDDASENDPIHAPALTNNEEIQPQPNPAIEEALPRIGNDTTSGIISVQMSPKKLGPITARSPVRQAGFLPSSLKRKEPTDPFESASRPAREPVELIHRNARRPDSLEGLHKRQYIADVRDPLEIAPREPRSARECRESFHGSHREHDINEGVRRYDVGQRTSYHPHQRG